MDEGVGNRIKAQPSAAAQPNLLIEIKYSMDMCSRGGGIEVHGQRSIFLNVFDIPDQFLWFNLIYIFQNIY